MAIKVIVFDLDDTLYEELQYVRSGHKAVAQFLAPILQQDSETIFLQLQDALKLGREGAFDRVLSLYKKTSKRLIASCLQVYRQHDPKISLYPLALSCFEQLKDYPLYVVTDGNIRVQRRKCRALGLDLFMKRCICSWAYGRKFGKPSPHCFLKICSWEKVMPKEVVYVSDNPHKDFVGIKPLGFRTIRVQTGPYSQLAFPTAYDAEVTISNLMQMPDLLKKQKTFLN